MNHVSESIHTDTGPGTHTTRQLCNASVEEIETAYQKAEAISRKHAGNFQYAFNLLPEAQRKGIQALYAFCRAGDDASDEEAADKGAQDELLGSVRRRLDLVFRGLYLDDLTLALAHAHSVFHFDRRHFDDLILGLTADLHVNRYPTFRELKRYCYRVASTVGLLCLSIFGCDTPRARIYAENLGIAMQLTNILRDLAEDRRRGRVYLPVSDLNRFGLTPDNFLLTDNRASLKQLVDFEVQRTLGYFDFARQSLPPENRKQLSAAIVMGAIYRVLLKRIAKASRYDVRISIPDKIKTRLSSRVFNTGKN
jgi:phytoene synthase